MYKMNWKWTLVFSAAVVGATAILDAQAWAGKPAPPPPPLVNPTAVKYQIQFWRTPDGGSMGIQGTNNWGDTVGFKKLGDGTTVIGAYYHAMLFLAPSVATSATLTAIDLYEAMGSKAPAGWVIASATDINDDGVIVGYLFPGPYDEDVSLGYVLDTQHLSPDVSTWTFRLLPTDAMWSYSRPRRINENGDIAGVYRKPDLTWGAYFIPAVSGEVVELLNQNVGTNLFMNNPDPDAGRAAQVAGISSDDGGTYCWTTSSDVPDILSSLSLVGGINDSGTISGSTFVKRTRYPARYNASLANPLQILLGVEGYGRHINSDGDLVVESYDHNYYLYHDAWKYLKVDALIDPNDPHATAWFSRKGHYLDSFTDRIITDPSEGEETEFGLVSGTLTNPDSTAVNFLLIPVRKTP